MTALRTLVIIAIVERESVTGDLGLRRRVLRGALVAAMLVAPMAAQQKSGETSSTEEKRMTPAQAKELFRSVDEILGFVSSDTKLPIQHKVKRTLISRDQVGKFLRKRFDEDESTKRIEQSELVLKKFGLLDADFHLGPFMIELLTEQIAGFYDNKTKVVNLLDWIAPDEQKPVLAHELTHALQDQKIGLEKWSNPTEDSLSKNVREDNQHIQTDEEETVREAVAEGQAMAVFVDYAMKPSGKTLLDAPPEVMNRFRELATDTSGSPVLARAPLLLQESLLFPYSEGLSFEQVVMQKAGRERAFAGTLEAPPNSTQEILHPELYLKHTPVPVLRMPDVHPLLDAEYAPYDIGVMGELDVHILAGLFGGPQVAKALAPLWNGGIYYAAQKRSAVTPAEKQALSSLGLMYYSRWANPPAARAFLQIYQAHLVHRYSGLTRRKQDEADATEQVYSTSEGDVLLSISGAGMFVSEGFPVALARKLRDEVIAAQPSGPIETAEQPKRDPVMDLSRTISSYGLMKAAFAR